MGDQFFSFREAVRPFIKGGGEARKSREEDDRSERTREGRYSRQRRGNGSSSQRENWRKSDNRYKRYDRYARRQNGEGKGDASGNEPHYWHHRQRLRDKFLASGISAIADYELMELILFRAIPRRDVKPLAKRILDHFGDINHAISAPYKDLLEIRGVGPAVAGELKIIEAAAHRLAQARVIGQDVISSWDQLMAYCKAAMAHRQLEEFRILFLDSKNILILDEAQQKGTVDHVPVYPREVVKRALEINASALILVHNHPSGDPSPSDADIQMTQAIIQAASAVNIEVHDHVIIGKEADFSFRSSQLL